MSRRDGEPVWLYRLYDAEERPLYFGITRDVLARITVHANWGLIWRQASILDLRRLENRRAALDAERAAIIAERPRYNVAHNPLCNRRDKWPLFGAWLRDVRGPLGQFDVAHRCGIPLHTYRRLELGRVRVGAGIVCALADGLGIDLDFVLRKAQEAGF